MPEVWRSRSCTIISRSGGTRISSVFPVAGSVFSTPTFSALEFRQIEGNGLLDLYLPLFGKHHDGQGRKGFRHGSHEEDGITLHGNLLFPILIADGFKVARPCRSLRSSQRLPVSSRDRHPPECQRRFVSKRSEERPTSSGVFALGSPWATAATATSKKSTTSDITFTICFIMLTPFR